MVFIIISSVIFLDQISKFIVTRQLFLHESIAVIKGIFHLTLVYNRGAAFGIFKNQTLLFIITSLIAIVLIVLKLYRHHRDKISCQTVSLCLILGGAAGNLIDRMFFGYVIDFIDFRVWPVFNIADSAITVGAVLLGISILRKTNART